MKWSKEEVELLERLWFSPEYTASAIAREMGRSRYSIVRKARHLNLPRRLSAIGAIRKHSDKVRKMVRDGYEAGFPARMIAQNITDSGHTMTKNAVIGLAHRMKLEHKSENFTPPKFVWETDIVKSARPTASQTCNWIVGIEANHPHRVNYCQHSVKSGEIWCAEHADIVYVRSETLRQGASCD